MKQHTSPGTRYFLPVLAALIIAIAFAFFLPRTAHAATTTAEMRKLVRGRTYTCYDVTGDRKHDVFKYQAGETGYTNLYINNRYVNRIWTARGAIVYWARITNSKVFLVVNYGLYGGNGNTILQYKNGKFRPVSGKAVGKYNYLYANPSRVAGHSIFFTGSPRNMPSEFVQNDKRVTGTSQFRLENGSFSLVSRYLKVGGTTVHRTQKGFYTSTSNKKKNTSGMYVPAGATVKIIKIYKPSEAEYAGGTWYLLQYGRRTGWLYAW